jgi:hypothetical protein
MPDALADVIVATLKIVNLILSTWVDLGAPDPLTSQGSALVDNVAQAAVAMAHTVAQLSLNNPIP